MIPIGEMMHALRNERHDETADIAEAIENMKAIAENRQVGPAYSGRKAKQTLMESNKSIQNDEIDIGNVEEESKSKFEPLLGSVE